MKPLIKKLKYLLKQELYLLIKKLVKSHDYYFKFKYYLNYNLLNLQNKKI
jgi:hypothetical protein